MKRFIRDQWEAARPATVKPGDYVVATKYRDGDPGDQFCIGFYDGAYDHYGTTRHLVVDGEGKQFRANGFRRVEKISARRGAWMVRNLSHIEAMKDRYSVWHWRNAVWPELHAIDPFYSES